MSGRNVRLFAPEWKVLAGPWQAPPPRFRPGSSFFLSPLFFSQSYFGSCRESLLGRGRKDARGEGRASRRREEESGVMKYIAMPNGDRKEDS